MNSITLQHLNAIKDRIADSLGLPNGPVWTPGSDGQMVSTVGALVIEKGSRTYGPYWKLFLMMNESGGQRIIVSAPDKRGLRDAMWAYWEGIEAGKLAAARMSAGCSHE